MAKKKKVLSPEQEAIKVQRRAEHQERIIAKQKRLAEEEEREKNSANYVGLRMGLSSGTLAGLAAGLSAKLVA